MNYLAPITIAFNRKYGNSFYAALIPCVNLTILYRTQTEVD